MMLNFSIPPIDPGLKQALANKINLKTKPIGALGQLEQIALQTGLIQDTLSPQLHHPVMMVFAADHGISIENVSPYPQSVTQQMVLNFLSGGAAINVFCHLHGLSLTIIDAGVNADFDPHPQLINAKVAKGTANFLIEPAMTTEQCHLAIERGKQLVMKQIHQGSNVIGFGEMGIANTSSASALMASITGLPLTECTGNGTGLNESGLLHKVNVLTDALQRHVDVRGKALPSLIRMGGFEIAMMMGGMLEAAEKRCLIIVDGFITTVALLIAQQLYPAILDYCIFSHTSQEKGHSKLLSILQADPLLALNLRLGEGTGAALAYPLIESAVAFLNQMASFEEANVSQKTLC